MTVSKQPVAEQDPLTHRIIGAAMSVHSELGPGLLESVYLNALCVEPDEQGIRYRAEQPVDVIYRGRHVSHLYADIIVEGKVIIELKSVEKLAPIHTAQLITYLKSTGVRTGLLINSNVRHLRDGIKRLAN